MAQRDGHKVLIRGVNWIGDAVMTIPALRAVRANFPGSSISLLVRPSVAPLFDREPAVDEIIQYGHEFRGVSGRMKLASTLRAKGFTTAILFQNAFDAALLVSLAGVPERIGYNRDGRGILLTKAVSFRGEDRKLHHIDYYLNLLDKAGYTSERSRPWLRLTLEERLAARETLSTMSRPILGINPGAAFGSAKRWVLERFAEVARSFTEETGGSVAVFGGKDEAATARYVQALIPHRSRSFAGRTSLRELVALIAECDVVVSNDSGPMHIAYAVGTPVVAIFGSTDPKLTGPAGEGSTVVQSGVPCSPCFERTCREKHLACMDGISADAVFEAVRTLTPRRRAVFFDRDGTLCRDADYLNRWEDFSVFPEIEALDALKTAGFSLVGVSNQSGIGRGIVDESFARDVNRVFIERYGFDDFLYCPHRPEELCFCRKPEPAMLIEAKERLSIDLRKSYVVGDKDDDMLLARAVGARGILVTTGKLRESVHADHIARDLREAVRIILGDSDER